MAIPGLPTIDNLSGEDMAKAILQMAVRRRPQDMQFDMNGDGRITSADALSYLKQFKAATPQPTEPQPTAPQPTVPQPLMQNLQIQAGLNQYNPVNTQAFQDQQQRVGQASTSMNMTSDVLTTPIPLPNVYTPPPIDMTGRMTMAEAKAARMAELGLPYQPEPVSNLTPDQMGQQMQQQAAAMAKGATQPTASTQEMLALAESQGLNAAMGPGIMPTAQAFPAQKNLPQAQSLPYQPPYQGFQPFNPLQQQMQAEQLRYTQQSQPQGLMPMYQGPQMNPPTFTPTPLNQQSLLGQSNPFLGNLQPKSMPLQGAFGLSQQSSPFFQELKQGGTSSTPSPTSLAGGLF